MNFLRICLVVLLAVLLPIRSAMAATMPCAGGTGHGSPHLQAADPAHHPLVTDGDAAPAHTHAPHHGSDATAGHDHNAQERCNMCSATCSIPPLPSAFAALEAPTALSAASFPDVSAPAPTFQSDGQERPPRTF